MLDNPSSDLSSSWVKKRGGIDSKRYKLSQQKRLE